MIQMVSKNFLGTNTVPVIRLCAININADVPAMTSRMGASL